MPQADLDKCTAGTLHKIARVFNVTVDSILENNSADNVEYRCSFETFKSNTCHHVKDMGDIDFIIETLESVEDGTATLTKQDDSLSNYASMLSKDISPIDFTQSAQAVHNKVRGLNSWPSATAIMDGKRIKIHKTKLADACGQAGEIVSLEPFIVACGSGAIEILELQPEGKKKMTAEAFLAGHRLSVGDVIG